MAARRKRGHVVVSPSGVSYRVVKLSMGDRMPILFGGQSYDLARLTESQLAYLLKFPKQVPYLRRL